MSVAEATPRNGIGLALSGGGVRAAVFHLGVLRRLASEHRLEDVTGISTVSGGSLATALLMSRSGMRWPTSANYLSSVYPALRTTLTTADLFGFRAIGWKGLFRFNNGLVHDRARVLATLLHERWGITGNVRDLPETPHWWLNTTCLETGKNWRFARREMGDWVFGRHFDPEVSLAEAAAASAAVPYVIGALKIQLPEHGWYRTKPQDRSAQVAIPRRELRVSLWDGGAYENLGLEAMFKPNPVALIGCDLLIVSDASGPFSVLGRNNLKRSPWRIFKGELASPRLFDIASDQIRGLRSRMFVAELERKTVKGALLRMGNAVRDVDIKDRSARTNYDEFQSSDEVAQALRFPTGLTALSVALFDRIARHGYELADAILTRRLSEIFRKSYRWEGTT